MFLSYQRKKYSEGDQWLKGSNKQCRGENLRCFRVLTESAAAQCTQLVAHCRWKPIWFLCVTESFSWTTGPTGTKTDREWRRRGRESERERETWRPGPPGQTIAMRWECGSRALPVPKVHSCRLGYADQNSPRLVQVLHLHRQQSHSCYGNYHIRDIFLKNPIKVMHARVIFYLL